MASFGHSGSHAPQLMQSSLIVIAIGSAPVIERGPKSAGAYPNSKTWSRSKRRILKAFPRGSRRTDNFPAPLPGSR
jgi:hypothetical protein